MPERKLMSLSEFKQSVKRESGTREHDRDWFKEQFPDTILAAGGIPKMERGTVPRENDKFFHDPDLQIKFIISNDTLDRDNDTISVAGWDLKNFKKNPVVLWAHDQRQPPIARSVETIKENGNLIAVAQFPQRDLHAFGHMVFNLFQGGFMSAVSVGFDPTKWIVVDEEGRGFGFDFIEQELLEFSAVPVPSNPDALSVARSKGIDTGPMKEWADRVHDELEGNITATGLPMSKQYIEELARSADPKQRVAIPHGLILTNIDDDQIEVRDHNTISYDEAHKDHPPVAAKLTPFDRAAENTFVPDKSGSMGAYLGESYEAEIALLHHHAAGQQAVNWKGLLEATAYCFGKSLDETGNTLVKAIGEVRVREAFEHLARHYREDFDTEPPSTTHLDKQTLRDFCDSMCLDQDTGLVRTKTDGEIHQEDFDGALELMVAAGRNFNECGKKLGGPVGLAIEPICEAIKQIDQMGIDAYAEACEIEVSGETCAEKENPVMLSGETPDGVTQKELEDMVDVALQDKVDQERLETTGRLPD